MVVGYALDPCAEGVEEAPHRLVAKVGLVAVVAAVGKEGKGAENVHLTDMMRHKTIAILLGYPGVAAKKMDGN
ncbi:MAG: hypothetical protein OHK0039_41650 [Bacteroidia bacterium]